MSNNITKESMDLIADEIIIDIRYLSDEDAKKRIAEILEDNGIVEVIEE